MRLAFRGVAEAELALEIATASMCARQEHGKTAYMTQKRGEHRICVQCQGSKWFQTTALKWELHVDMGDTEFSRNPATKQDACSRARAIRARLSVFVRVCWCPALISIGALLPAYATPRS